MFIFAFFFHVVALALESSRPLWLEPLARLWHARPESHSGTPRFYFDIRIGGSVIPDDIGAFGLSEEDALADAIAAMDEIGNWLELQGEDIGVDEIIVRDDEGQEVGRIDLSRWRGRAGL
jgi:hypothetical protein